jgi:hypothetical protein
MHGGAQQQKNTYKLPKLKYILCMHTEIIERNYVYRSIYDHVGSQTF